MVSAPIATYTGTLPQWVNATNQFQHYYILNKAVLDLTSVDIPYIALAKKNEERKERIFRQALVFGFAFCIAPLHAKVFSLEMSKRFLGKEVGTILKQHNLPADALMQASFKHLLSAKGVETSIETLFVEKFKQPVPEALRPLLNTEDFRKKLVNAKSLFLVADLVTEGLFFTSLGMVKNLFSQLFIMKNNQFSGEQGIVSDEKLKKIHEQDKQKETVSQRWKNALALGLGIAVPASITLTLRQAMLSPNTTNGILKSFQKFSDQFDYQYIGKAAWPIITLVPFGVVGYLNDVADILNSRSPREANENSIKLIASSLFIFGDLLWMSLLSTVMRNKDFNLPLRIRTSIQKSMNWVLEKTAKQRLSQEEINQKVESVASQATISYMLSYLLNGLCIAGSIVLMNKTTRQTIKTEAIDLQPATIKKPSTPSSQPCD
jgi:hypothetical protein